LGAEPEAARLVLRELISAIRDWLQVTLEVRVVDAV
jgi:hypothetical protein